MTSRTWFTKHILTAIAAAMLLCLFTSIQARAQGLVEGTEDEQIAVLQSDEMQYFDKILACKKLSILGTEKSIPVLAALLGDEKFNHYARYGLEPIPSEKVDEALRAALPTLEGNLKCGVITSIGVRGDKAAAPLLIPLLKSDDPAIVSATAFSLGQIATPEAVDGLTVAIENPTAASERPGQAGLADGALKCAETLAEQGDADAAVAMFSKLRTLDSVLKHVRLAAVYHELQITKDLQLLGKLLDSSDGQHFDFGLRTARQLSDVPEVGQVLVGLLADSSNDRQALIIAALGDRGDAIALPAIIKYATDGSASLKLRLSAITALAKFDDASVVPTLFTLASSDNEAVATLATDLLATLKQPQINETIIAALQEPSEAAQFAVALQLAGQRRVSQAVPVLLDILKNGDQDQKLTAIAALGETVSLDQLDVLTALLGTNTAIQEPVKKAIHATVIRMPDRAALTAKLATLIDNTSGETRLFLMNELIPVGGVEALEVIAQSANSQDDELKDYATRVLGSWLGTDAAPVLLDLAKKESSSKYGVRAVRGYIRLIRQFDMSQNQRNEMCETALTIITRDDERRLLLEVLQRYPSKRTLGVAMELTKVPSVKADAEKTVVAIQGKM